MGLSNNRTILFVVSSFFPDNTAGTEMYVLHLAKGLRAKGWLVKIVIPSRLEKPNYEYDGIPVLPFKVSESLNLKQEYGKAKFEGEKRFLDILKEEKPQIVHFHTLLSRTIPVKFALRAAELVNHVFVTPHLGGFFCLRGDYMENGKKSCNGFVNWRKCGSCFFEKSSWIYSVLPKSLIWNLLGKAQLGVRLPIKREKELNELKASNIQFIAIADWIHSVFQVNGFKNITTILQGVPSKVMEKKDRSFSKDILKVLFVGRITPSKGLDLLVEAFEKLHTKIQISILGIPDPCFKDYGTDLRKRVQIKGGDWKENGAQDEVFQAMMAADLLVLPSRSNEMAPLVILEAIRLGLPVLGSSLLAVQEMIHHYSCGWVFENGNLSSLIREILAIKEKGPVQNFQEKSGIQGRTELDVLEEQEQVYLKLM